MLKNKDQKINPLAASVENDVTKVKVGDLTYQTRGSIKKVEGEKSIETLEKALREGVFSDLKSNEPENK